MPIHDWTRVEAGIFHSFHNAWITHLGDALNGGLLPPNYYALGEQHAGRFVTDILTLHASPANGGRRTLAIRHVRGHCLIAMVKIVSPANKDRLESVDEFVAKTVEALDVGVHVLLLDLLPPGRLDPRGLHGAVWNQFDEGPYDLPVAELLTLASFNAGPQVKAFLEHLAVGGTLAEMPLFLHAERYVPVPLEATYQAGYLGVPAFWRNVLEGREAPAGG